MKKRVIILTGSELRHDFFRKAIALSHGIQVLRSYCEGLEKSLSNVMRSKEDQTTVRLAHVASRERSEEDFFGPLVKLAPDWSNAVHIRKGAINEPRYTQEIVGLKPDLLVAYGCSIVREPLLLAFHRRFLNAHLGLSPYYRGSGTNFWALVNAEPEYVGATFMHIDAGVDTGEVIHQIRARLFPGDSPHQVGNRLIADMTIAYAKIIRRFDVLPIMPQIPVPQHERVCRNKDFSEEATQRLYTLFAEGLVDRYLAEQESRCAQVPLVVNPGLSGETIA